MTNVAIQGRFAVALALCAIISFSNTLSAQEAEMNRPSGSAEVGIPAAILRRATPTFRNSYKRVNDLIEKQRMADGQSHPLLLLSRAELAIHAMDRQTAIDDITKALQNLESMPSSERAPLQKKSLQLTIVALKLPETSFKGDARGAASAGLKRFRGKQWIEAGSLFEAAAKLDSEDYRSCYFAATCHYKQRDYEKAEQWLRLAVQREVASIASYSSDIDASQLRINHAIDLRQIQGHARQWIENESLALLVRRGSQ